MAKDDGLDNRLETLSDVGIEDTLNFDAAITAGLPGPGFAGLVTLVGEEELLITEVSLTNPSGMTGEVGVDNEFSFVIPIQSNYQGFDWDTLV
jgi:hypothetical protein